MPLPIEVSPSSLTDLRKAYSALSECEFENLKLGLCDYFEAMWRIFERLERERPEVIDELTRTSTMKTKVDSSKRCPE
jgi:hypothetical protein